MELSAEMQDILTACLRRQRALEAVPDLLGIFSRWCWHMDEYEYQREHGPRWDAGAWFGPRLPEYKRQRYVRAAKALAAAGLLVAHKEHDRLSHVKLTAQGERLALELASGAGCVEADGSSASETPDTTGPGRPGAQK